MIVPTDLPDVATELPITTYPDAVATSPLRRALAEILTGSLENRGGL